MPHRKADETPWTPEEIKKLQELYPSKPYIKTLLPYFPDRTVNQIRCKARHLGIKRTPKIGLQDPLDIPPTAAAYIAGMIDGEGSISLRTTTIPTRKRKISIGPYVAVYNCNTEVLKWLRETTKLGYNRKIKQNHLTRKEVHEWSTKNLMDSARLLRTVLPYLIIKREQAVLVLKFCENRQLWTTYTDQELKMVSEIRKMNKRGI